MLKLILPIPKSVDLKTLLNVVQNNKLKLYT